MGEVAEVWKEIGDYNVFPRIHVSQLKPLCAHDLFDSVTLAAVMETRRVFRTNGAISARLSAAAPVPRTFSDGQLPLLAKL